MRRYHRRAQTAARADVADDGFAELAGVERVAEEHEETQLHVHVMGRVKWRKYTA
jgi:diadenosine tetraphosphate (Ap4A) HIT family hydrolase